jgi:DNA-binding NarL/FixJ family response regulator
MPMRIAVFDPLPVYRRGIIAALGDAGMIAEAPDDPLEWSRQDAQQIVFLTLQSQADWQLMTRLRHAHGAPLVVAVLTDTSVSGYLKALSGGAAVAVPRNAPPERLRQIFEEAVRGMSLLPIGVVRALARTGRVSDQVEDVPSTHERKWLQELASGTTVTQLAEQSGYSERSMYRLLQDLYRRIGVRTRTEALIRAYEQGWL